MKRDRFLTGVTSENANLFDCCSFGSRSSIRSAYVNARAGDNAHIDGAVKHPPRRRRIVRYTIRLHTPQESSSLSQLIIGVLEGLVVSNNITVIDNSEGKINVKFSVTGSKVIVSFPQPVAPESKLELDLNNVKRRGASNAWLSRVSAKLVSVDVNILLVYLGFTFTLEKIFVAQAHYHTLDYESSTS